MSDLFSSAPPAGDTPRPLADRLRPMRLADVVGQEHLLGQEGAISRMLAAGSLPSLILWGPPGVGKTTIARLLAAEAGLEFVSISAVFSGVKDMRAAFEQAQRWRNEQGRGTLLFVDEIHRFNRAQQDGFLPYIETGVVTLIGATTENPSFELNGALLSRCSVLVLNRLAPEAMIELMARAADLVGRDVPIEPDARDHLIAMADGDGRYFLNLLEQVFALSGGGEKLDRETLSRLLQKRASAYDKSRDEHYNLISALHKSVRGSDPDAALYWLARMIQGGEDPRYIARRMIRLASEDIGLADPTSLMIASEAARAYERLGSPEGDLALAHAVLHLATAPKSNAAYAAWKAAQASAARSGSLSPPKHILNAPTALMKGQGYGEGYEYDHDAEDNFSGQAYFPDEMPAEHYYEPGRSGREAAIAEHLERLAKLREKRRP